MMKKVLFITYDYPYPTNTGGKNRAYHMLKYSGSEFKKYLYSFVRPDFKPEYVSSMDKIGVETVGTDLRRKTTDLRNIFGVLKGDSIFKTLYYSNKVAVELLQTIKDKQIDIVHFESFYAAFYISNRIKDLGVKQVFGTENIEFKLYEDYVKNNVNPVAKSTFKKQVDRIRKEETALFSDADICLAVTPDEVEFIKKYNKNTYRVSNGVDIDDFKFVKPSREVGDRLLFVGNFTYFPNVEAINSFYENVFKKLNSNTKLTIIGKKSSSLSFSKSAGIETIDFIPDIKSAYNNADVLISPVKIGGGTNFKILEAMAAGVPIIALKGRMEAVGVEDGKHVLVAENDNDFKEKIQKLLSDLKLRQKLAVNAREFVEKKYSWKVIGGELAKAWSSL